MTLKNEELLSRYFERKMTSGEEQNFLISVAANDELRLAFRSQLELMRAVSNDKDGIRSAVEVRSRTLAALGLSTLAADEFLEHDLLSRKTTEPAQAAGPVEPVAHSASGFTSFLRSPITTVVGGLAVGFMAAIAIFSNPEPEVGQPARQQVVSPQIPVPSAQETGAMRNVESKPNAPILLERPPVSTRQSGSATNTASRKPQGETIAPNSGLDLEANGATEPTIVDKQNPGLIQVNPPKINKPKDSTAKQ